MFKNHFKIALRNLFLHKTFSFINILGLSIGVAAFIMVLLWIQNEFEYDQFHTNIDRLHRVMSNQSQSETEIFTTAATPGLLSKAIKEEVPEISMAVRTTWRMPKKLTYQNITAEERGYYVDSQFLKMFTFPLKQGEAEIALTAPENIVISQKLADKYFGDEMAIGNTLTVGDSKDYIVTGILEDIPVLSSLQFDFLLPFQAFEAENQWLQNWGENGIYTWTMLKKQANLDDASRKIATILTNNKRQRNSELILQPIKDMYLYTDFKNGKYGGGGKIKNVRLFGIIGFMIILIACVNFMNLSTARSRARAKEIGVRKVIGAQRSFLVHQFFIESFLMALIAVLLGLLLVDLCLPYFNNLASSTMHISYGQSMTWIVLLGVLTLTSLLSGSYPALVLSSLKPLKFLISSLS